MFIIKKLLLLSALLAPLNSVFGMESPLIKSSRSPFDIAELRLLITTFIGEQLSIEEAIKTIKAWALTDTRSYGFFQTPEHAQSFLKWFNALSYHNDFTLRWLQSCNTLLPKEEVSAFNHSVEKGQELVKLLETCASKKEWSTFYTEASKLEESGLSKYLAHYYWKSTYMYSEAKKTLLLFALELQAPQEVITALIRWGSCLTELHKKTPPPCLIVCQNIITLTKEYDEKLKEPRANTESLKKEYEPLFEKLKETLHELIKQNASLNDSFFTPNELDITNTTTPLDRALEANNAELVKYLSEQKVQCRLPLITSTLNKFAQGKISYSTLEALLSRGNIVTLTCLFHMMIEVAIQSNDEKIEEKYCELVPLFLNLKVDINAVTNRGLTILDMVNQCGKKDSKIAALLIANGAISPNPKDESFQTLNTELVCKTQSFFELLSRGNTVTRKADSMLFLSQIKTILSTHDKAKVSGDLVHNWLFIALNLDFSEHSSSHEGKEFLKFIASRFPGYPLFEELVHHNRTIKLQMDSHEVNSKEAYKPILKQTKDILLWFSKEGVKNSSLLQAIDVAKKFGMDELAVYLMRLLTNS